MKPKILVSGLLAAGIGLAVIGGYADFGPAFGHARAASPAGAAAPAAAQPATIAALPDFTGIVAQTGPAVVNVSVTEKGGRAAGSVEQIPNLSPDDPFYQFFRHFQIPFSQGQIPRQGVGSGFIVSPDGLILTNAHVVADADEVTVKLTDKREFTAKVVGIDKPSDIAVLKIDAHGLPTAKLDGADDVKVGQWVVAIGSPYGFENTVTAGIVSAKSRTLPDESYVPFIQTDVAVNPGNSGGPLINLKGEVVGINSQIYTHSGGYQGLSFAIPINVALKVKDELLAHGSVTRGQLGVAIQEVNQALADSFGLKQPAGALVSAVTPGSPAARAGLKAGDVILAYNGRQLASSTELPALVAATTPGATAKLDVLRNGRHTSVDVKVGELSSPKVASADEPGQERGRLGVLVRPLTSEEQKEAGVSGGLVVESARGPAADAGIQPGDLVLSVNGTPVSSVAQLKDLLSKAGQHIALLVKRADSTIFVPVDLG